MVVGVLAGTAPSGVGSIRADEVSKEAKEKEAQGKASKGDAKAVAKPKIAVFRLAGAVSESPADETFSFGGLASVSLHDLVARIDEHGVARALIQQEIAVLLEGADHELLDLHRFAAASRSFARYFSAAIAAGVASPAAVVTCRVSCARTSPATNRPGTLDAMFWSVMM